MLVISGEATVWMAFIPDATSRCNWPLSFIFVSQSARPDASFSKAGKSWIPIVVSAFVNAAWSFSVAVVFAAA
jgi:hypothetical protein